MGGLLSWVAALDHPSGSGVGTGTQQEGLAEITGPAEAMAEKEGYYPLLGKPWKERGHRLGQETLAILHLSL